MNKNTKIARIVAAVLIVLGFAISFIAHGRGEGLPSVSFNGETSAYSLSDSGYTPCPEGEIHFTQEDLRVLEVDWAAGSVTVESYDGADLALRETSAASLSEAQHMRWKISGQRLSIHFCANGQRNVPAKALTVLVPKGWLQEEISVDVGSADVSLSGLSMSGTLDIDGASGEIRILNCACGDVEIDGASGDVHIENTRLSEEVDIDTASGDAIMTGVSAAAIDVDTASGAVQLEGTAAKLNVNTASGSVTLTGLQAGCSVEVGAASGSVWLSFEGKPDRVRAETASGGVRLRFPAGTGLDLDYETASGDLNGKALFFGSGDVPVDVDTASGDLTIEYHN